jgi:hypothetical protein
MCMSTSAKPKNAPLLISASLKWSIRALVYPLQMRPFFVDNIDKFKFAHLIG